MTNLQLVQSFAVTVGEDGGGRKGAPSGANQEAGSAALLPGISVPKGGGAIASIGEKFQVSAATGTGAASVPIAMSPGRGGFGPSLGLAYDSGAGNGPFGLGWSIGLPSIQRKTQRGLPRYRDTDTFVLAGAEDLVPVVLSDGTDDVVVDSQYSQIDGQAYQVRRYRPRIEGLFARIEKWVRDSDGDTHWRMITGDNVTTVLGQSPDARVHWPGDPTRTFEWFIERTYDDKGNVVVYEYERENEAGIANELHETHRLALARAFAQTYLKRVRYGNSQPYLVHLNREGRSGFDEAMWWRDNAWYFELVFDYGDHTADVPSPAPDVAWPARRDPFSTYRPGFEVRTWRLCHRILMFHHFGDQVGDEPMLVRSTNLHFDGTDGLGNPTATQLAEASHTAYEPGFAPARSPGVRFSYSAATVGTEVLEISLDDVATVPDGGSARWIDLLGEGLSGVLTRHDGAWRYQRNAGDGRFEAPAMVASIPSLAATQSDGTQLGDVDASGALNLIARRPGVVGTYEIDRDDVWQPLVAFDELPNIDWDDPNLRMIDVTGDGVPDLLITEDTCLRFYPAKGREGYSESEVVAKALRDDAGPAIVFAESGQAIINADMSGDGLSDIVRIREGEVCYWPNTGYGTFGAKVTMSDAPFFDDPSSFDPRRLRVGDVDGSGTADIIYLGARHVRLWGNQAGNRFAEEQVLAPFPMVDNMATVEVLDLLGSGTAALVWTSTPADSERPIRYLPLMSEGKPYLLNSIDNGMGAITNITYAPSTKFYLQDRRAGRPWISKLPFPVHVVERVDSIDAIRGNRFVTRTAYHHGAYDGVEREFRGFGMVETWDTEAYEAYSGDASMYVPPVHTKTWFHTGGYFDRHIVSRQYAREYHQVDAAWQLPDTALPPGLDASEQREACRALKGRTLRSEVYALDGSDKEAHPYAITEGSFHIRLEQPRGENEHAVFFVCDCESLSIHLERNPADPRIAHTHTLKLDHYGRTVEKAAIAYPRMRPQIPEQGVMHVTTEEASFIDIDGDPWTYRTGLPLESKSYEAAGLAFSGRWEKPDLIAAIHPARGPDPRRLLGRKLVRYYRDSLDELDVAPFGSADTLGVAFEQYQLAFDDGVLRQPELGGRITPALLAEAGYRNDVDDASTWWVPSGHAVFGASPEANFYQALESRDPFGNASRVELDRFRLFPMRAFDAYDNETSAEIDYRVLAPRLVTDANGNRVEVVHDTRGMVIATAVMGKDEPGAAVEGDSVATYARVLDTSETGIAADVLANPRRYLQGASSFFYYDVFAWRREGAPANFVGLARETHLADEDGTPTRIQRSVRYSDGRGQTLLAKVEAEDGDAPVYAASGALALDGAGQPISQNSTDRWIGNGATIFNNKGAPVRQFEPFFDSRPDFTTDEALVHIGVSPLVHYDPLGRVTQTDLPDGTATRVEFDPWQQVSFDASDTLLEPGNRWFAENASTLSAAEREQAELHAQTPTRAIADSLGRPIVSIVHNKRRVRQPDGTFVYADEFIPTRTELDIAGTPIAIYDGRRCEGLNLEAAAVHRGNTVMSYAHAYGGMQLYENSMDGGERWGLVDVTGSPLHSWDARGHHLVTEYDRLRRPTAIWLSAPGVADTVTELIVYGESLDPLVARSANLRGQLVYHFDGAGMIANEDVSFKGEVVSVTRTLPASPTGVPDWSALVGLEPEDMASAADLEAESFRSETQTDALGRAVATTTPDGSVQHHLYNKAGLLESVAVRLHGGSALMSLVTSVETNARGQRTRVGYGNRTETIYSYDEKTYRLSSLVTTGPRGTYQDLSYRYDAVGNILSVRDAAIEPVFFRNEIVEPESRYVYDSLHRLIEASGRESAASRGRTSHVELDIHTSIPAHDRALRNYTQRYDYDPVGNILLMRHITSGEARWTREYDYEEHSNRLVATGDLGQPLDERYPHDAAGNITSMPHLAALHWDYKDQLVATDIGPHNALHCHYDAGRERARKVHLENGRRSERLYFGGFEIHRTYSGGVEKTRLDTLHIADANERLCMIETPTIEDGNAVARPSPRYRYQLSNHLGSATAELTEDGEPITYEEYHPYGTSAFRSNNGRPIAVSAKRYRYTGMERDEETGLSYHSARYYVGWLGRWGSSDPEGLIDGPDLYRYCQDSPVRLRDTAGTQPQEDPCVEDCDSGIDGQSEHEAPREAVEEAFRTAGFEFNPGLGLESLFQRVIDLGIDLEAAGLGELLTGGIVAHMLIGAWFRVHVDATAMIDNGMMQIARRLQSMGSATQSVADGNNGRRPDIYRPSTGEVWEIKPEGQSALALTEAEAYVGWMSARGYPAQLGETFPEGRYSIDLTPNLRLEFRSPRNGVVTYRWRTRRVTEPVAVPAGEREGETEPEGPGLLERLGNAMPDMPHVRAPELRPQPQITLSMVVGGILLLMMGAVGGGAR